MTDFKATPKRSKRANGEGAISKRKDGRVEVKFTLPNGKRRSVYGKTKGEALAKKDDALRKARRGIDLQAERQPLGTFLNLWFAEVASQKNKASTLKSYRSYLDNHIIPELGEISLSDLTPHGIQSFLNSRTNRGLSPRTVQYIRAILRSALNQAERWGYVDKNVAALAQPPRIVRRPVTPLDATQAQRLINGASSDRLGPLFAVAIYTGLRQGELLGLKWSDIDFSAKTVTVRHTVQKHDGEWKFTEPKSMNSRRTLPLAPQALDVLVKQQERIEEVRALAGSKWNEWDLVFPSAVGTPLDGSNVTHRLQTILKEANLPKQRFHDLRHCCATLLLSQGVSPRIIQEVLGHSQISLTLGTYSHVLPPMLQDAADAMHRTFRDASQKSSALPSDPR